MVWVVQESFGKISITTIWFVEPNVSCWFFSQNLSGSPLFEQKQLFLVFQSELCTKSGELSKSIMMATVKLNPLSLVIEQGVVVVHCGGPGRTPRLLQGSPREGNL